jgi:predicted nucleic acid-binding protein
VLRVVVDDPPQPVAVSRDPDDYYLIALAHAAGADYLVSGDSDLLDLENPHLPMLTPRQFLDPLGK